MLHGRKWAAQPPLSLVGIFFSSYRSKEHVHHNQANIQHRAIHASGLVKASLSLLFAVQTFEAFHFTFLAQ